MTILLRRRWRQMGGLLALASKVRLARFSFSRFRAQSLFHSSWLLAVILLQILTNIKLPQSGFREAFDGPLWPFCGPLSWKILSACPSHQKVSRSSELIFPTAWLFWVPILTCSQVPTLIHHQGRCFSDDSVGCARAVIFDIANGNVKRWAFDLLKSLPLFQNVAPCDLTRTCICHNQLPGVRFPSPKSPLLVPPPPLVCKTSNNSAMQASNLHNKQQ